MIIKYLIFFVLFVIDDGLNGPGITMDDPLLVAKLRNNYLIPPPNRSSTHIHRYHLDNPEVIDTSMGQAERIRVLLNNKVSNS